MTKRKKARIKDVKDFNEMLADVVKIFLDVYDIRCEEIREMAGIKKELKDVLSH